VKGVRSEYLPGEVQILGANCVLLRGTALIDAVNLVVRGNRTSSGSAHRGRFLALQRTLARALEVPEMSPTRHDDTTCEGERSDSETREGGDWLSTTDVAELLGVTVRHAQRLAPELGGFVVSGRWVSDRAAALAYKAFRENRDKERNDR